MCFLNGCNCIWLINFAYWLECCHDTEECLYVINIPVGKAALCRTQVYTVIKILKVIEFFIAPR